MNAVGRYEGGGMQMKQGRPSFPAREWINDVESWLNDQHRFPDRQQKYIFYRCLRRSEAGRRWWTTHVDMVWGNGRTTPPHLIPWTFPDFRAEFLRTTLPTHCHEKIHEALQNVRQRSNEPFEEYYAYVLTLVNDLSLMNQQPLDSSIVTYFLRGLYNQEIAVHINNLGERAFPKVLQTAR